MQSEGGRAGLPRRLCAAALATAAFCGLLLQPVAAADGRGHAGALTCKRSEYTCSGGSGYEGVPVCCSKLTAVCGVGGDGEPLCQPSPCGADLNPCTANSTRCVVTESYEAQCESGG